MAPPGDGNGNYLCDRIGVFDIQMMTRCSAYYFVNTRPPHVRVDRRPFRVARESPARMIATL
jgi:hypothetical protein